jgi:hypothetical protein
MKIAIIGGRSFGDYELVKSVLSDYLDKVTMVVSGGAKGADSFGEKWANENNIQTLIFKPDWNKYGKKAGHLRNTDIIDNCDMCIAFWDGKSTGTKDSIKKAKKMGKEILIVNYRISND